MILMEWQESYSVGVSEFDEHHRHIFDLLNVAYTACMENRQKDVLSKVIAEMAEYVCYHFTAEERQMEEHSYAGLAAHREEHMMFTRKVAELRKRLATDNDECTIDLLDLAQFLMTWLGHHILEVDMQYRQLLAGGVHE